MPSASRISASTSIPPRAGRTSRVDQPRRAGDAEAHEHGVPRNWTTSTASTTSTSTTRGGAPEHDHVIVVPATAGKDGNAKVANLGVGDWADVKVTLTGARTGQTAGFYLKAIEIASTCQFRLYFASIARANATYNALGAGGSAAFEETLAHRFPTSTAADFAPLEAGIVDEDTYVEQGLEWRDAHWGYLRYILSRATWTLSTSAPSRVSGSSSPLRRQSRDGRVLAPVHGAHHADRHRRESEPLLRRPHERRHHGRAGRRSARATSARPTRRPTRRSLSPASSWATTRRVRLVGPRLRAAVVRGQRLRRRSRGAGRQGASRSRTAAPRAATATRQGLPAGGTAQIYINLAGRDPRRRQRTRSATTRRSATDRQLPSRTSTTRQSGAQQVVLKVMKKEELRNVDGTDSLHPNRRVTSSSSSGRRTRPTPRRRDS